MSDYQPVVYTAGPIRAKTLWEREGNIRKAEQYALWLWERGAAVICPHTMGRFYEDGHGPHWEMWIKGDLTMIERSDALFMLPGWEHSQGANLEKLHAEKLGLKILWTLLQTEEWIKAGCPGARFKGVMLSPPDNATDDTRFA